MNIEENRLALLHTKMWRNALVLYLESHKSRVPAVSEV